MWAYLIFVTGTTGGARVKNSVQCKNVKIEREEMLILHFWGVTSKIVRCILSYLI